MTPDLVYSDAAAQAYLDRYPDLQAAYPVANFATNADRLHQAWNHYQTFGRKEGRIWDYTQQLWGRADRTIAVAPSPIATATVKPNYLLLAAIGVGLYFMFGRN